MWTQMFEAWLNGVGLFVAPLVIVVALAGGLALAERFSHRIRGHHPR